MLLLRSQEIKPRNNIKSSGEIVLQDVTVTLNRTTILRDFNAKLFKGVVTVSGAVGCGKSTLFKTILGEYSPIRGNVSTRGDISYASQEPWIFPGTIKQNILFGEQLDDTRYKKVLQVCDLTNDVSLWQHGKETLIHDVNLTKTQRIKINLARALYRNCDVYLLDVNLTRLQIFENVVNFLKGALLLVASANRDEETVMIVKNEIDDDREKTREDNECDELLPKSWDPFVYDEPKKCGKIELKTYCWIIVYGGGFWVFLVVIFLITFTPVMTQYIDQSINFWICEEELTTNNTEKSNFDVRKQTVTNHLVHLLFLLVLLLASNVLFLNYFSNISLKLHELVARTIITAKLTYFDQNLVGNILNRLSADFVIMDTIPFMFHDTVKNVFSVISLLISITSTESISLTIILILLFLVQCFIRKLFVSNGCTLKRLQTSAQSGIVGHVNTTLAGLTTIRATNSQNLILEQFEHYQDLHTLSSLNYLYNSRAFSVSLDITTCCFFIVATFVPYSWRTILLTQVVSLAIYRLVQLETHMTSVERILEHVDIKLNQGINCAENLGEIRIEGVSLRHASIMQPVLNNLSFVIKPKEKIGIVGCSGSGKSSLFDVLCQFYQHEGQILINCSAITLISQQAMIFNGTLRQNLDPGNEHQDTEIWDVLECVHLKKNVDDLNMQIRDKECFSVGQKHLIALARVVLTKSKTNIVLVDQETATLISDVIQRNFIDCTVLIISQNVKNVTHCGRIMVLKNGEIARVATGFRNFLI